MFALLPAGLFAEQGLTEDYAPVVAAIVERGDVAIESYSSANTVETGNEFSRLYFDIFEGSGMEFTLNLKDSSLLLKIESGFSLMISQSMSGKPKDQLRKSWGGLKDDLYYAVEHYSSGGEAPSFWGKTMQSFLILFREGIEAMLVVAALVAYLRRSGYSDKVKVIWWGCGLALVASVAAAWLLNSVIQASGANREMLEGVTMLIAASVLIYVSYWLTAKKDADRWQAFVKEKMDKAMGEGSLFALGLVAFLAVFREGAETILFYQALVVGFSRTGECDLGWHRDGRGRVDHRLRGCTVGIDSSAAAPVLWRDRGAAVWHGLRFCRAGNPGASSGQHPIYEQPGGVAYGEPIGDIPDPGNHDRPGARPGNASSRLAVAEIPAKGRGPAAKPAGGLKENLLWIRFT